MVAACPPGWPPLFIFYQTLYIRTAKTTLFIFHDKAIPAWKLNRRLVYDRRLPADSREQKEEIL